MKKSLLLVSTATLFLSTGCGPQNKPAEENTVKQVDPVPVNVVTLTESDFEHYGTYYGKIEPVNEAVIISYAGGHVENIMVQEGQWVKKGQSLARIDAEKAQTLYETAVLGEKVAKDAWERQKKHLEQGNVSQVTVDQSRLNYLGARQQRIDAAKMRRGALCISPLSGRVVRKMVDVYEEVAPGSPTFIIAQTNSMKITAALPESDIVTVEKGNKAIVSIANYPDDEWMGTVRSIAEIANPATKKFEVEIVVNNDEGKLIAGITGKVKVLIQTFTDKVIVPTNTLLSEGEEGYVMVVDNNKAVKRNVQSGPSNEDETVILSGLLSGEKLIISGQSLVADGTPVTVVSGE